MARRKILPKFNRYSYYIEENSAGKLLVNPILQSQTGRIGLVSMPTGSGKSGIISCLPYFLGKLGLNPPPTPDDDPEGEPLHRFNKPVLVIAPDLAIASQLDGKLTISADAADDENFLLARKIVTEEDDDDQEVLPQGVKIQETAHLGNPKFLRNKDLVIANAQKFLQGNWEEVLPDDIFKLVIVDEAHHHPAKTWRRIIRKFKHHAMVVFLTATPFRADGRRVVEDEEGDMVYRLSLEDARTNRIIRRINWLQLVSGDTNLHNIFSIILERVKSIQQSKDRETPLPDNIPHMAIAITKNIAYAEDVRQMWDDHWGNHGMAIAYHSDLPKKTKLAMMEAIQSNQIKLVVVVDMLREGFDYPPISIAAIMTKIVSPVKFAQFIGRAQRIVRGHQGLESQEIFSDVVTHSYFQQEENYQTYEREGLIPDD
ncbi:uncharacterized protein LOC110058617 [Orbicella faveolata]|uniref:uncharacterized protein LOC110058617 n=1 Tax=Orbicella faveolata TaxID=48498 RepID=UPI0009E2AADB|nr:uncharacterized protein LOC110058617 [Orbicella faveolata]